MQVHDLNPNTTLLTNNVKLTKAVRISTAKEFNETHIFQMAKALGVSYNTKKIRSVAFTDPSDRAHSPVMVKFYDGAMTIFKGLLIKTVRHQRSPDLVKDLGLEYNPDGRSLATLNRYGETKTFGVYVVGDGKSCI